MHRVILVLTNMVVVAGLTGLISVAGAAESERGAFAPVREEPLHLMSADAMLGGAPDASVNWNTPVHPIFYDQHLMLRQYGFGVLTTVLAGSLGFYIGNAFEGAIFGSRSQKGYLSFTGIRYEHKRGPFWGGGTGLFVGSSMAVFFVGDMDEEQGSVLWTLAGGALSSAAAFALADAAGVQEKRGMLPFIPLLALPPIGAVGGYHVSRWFNDKKRHELTDRSAESVGGAMWHAPRLGFVPSADGTVMRLDALNLTF